MIWYKIKRVTWLYVSSSLLWLGMILLTYYFLVSDFRILYVWKFSNLSLPNIYKISAVWAGQEGTFLLWACMLMSIATVLAKRNEKAAQITLAYAILLTFLTFLSSPFKTIYEEFPDIPIGYIPTDGNGLNPLLVDPWMALHPPVIFLGYALTTPVFSYCLLRLWINYEEYAKESLSWGRWAWIFLTLGIALGGVWSYKVLGWGGFWAWDPVETSSLIPWLLLTAYLHTIKREREYRLISPLLGMMSFVAVLYASFITRSGILESVHAFAETKIAQVLLIAIFSTIAISALFLYKRKEKLNELSENKKSIELYITALIFCILSFILFFGITYPIFLKFYGTEIRVSKEFFNFWCYPFVIMLVSLLFYCTSKKKSHALILSLALLSLVLPLKNKMASFLLSILVISSIPVIKSIKARKIHLTHLGFILILIGAIVSTSFEDTYTITFKYPDELGTPKEFGKYSISLDEIRVFLNEKNNWIVESHFTIFNRRGIYRGKAWYEDDRKWGRVTHIWIKRRPLGDIYVIFQGFNPHEEKIKIPITIKTIPMINLLWIGIIFLILGLIIEMGES